MEKNFEVNNASGQRTPDQKKDGDYDKNGLHKDLWPYRDEMQEWVAKYRDDFGAFAEYKNAKFKLICGNGFRHRPDTGEISLSVPHYKECKDGGRMTIDQIMFGALHELGHAKTMVELDRAGKQNHLEQFHYEGKKRIPAIDDPTKYAQLQPTYRQFYNIMEDAIVNHLVWQTPHYGERVSKESGRRHQEVKDLYTDQFFPIFKQVPMGEGNYIKNPDPLSAKEKPYIFTGAGKGDLLALIKKDYDVGFDWTVCEPPMKRSGQFLIFFIKNQMIGLEAKDVFSEENPGGKFKLHKDVASVLTRPLVKVYEELLKNIIQKYQKEPQKLARYIKFMKDAIPVSVYQEKNGEVVEEEKREVAENVFSSSCVNDPDNLTVNMPMAKLLYGEKLKQIAPGIEAVDISRLTYLDVFNKYKQNKRERGYSWTLPLKLNLASRTRITRKVLEPIFTMLCILDNDFEIKMPPEKIPGEDKGEGDGGKASPEEAEKPEWKRGDKVMNIQDGNPNKGKKGIVTDIGYDQNGRVISVYVEYLDAPVKTTMAEEAKTQESGFQLSGEAEEIFDPNKNLALVAKKKKGKSAPSKFNDPRKKHFEDEEDRDEDKGEDREDDEDDDSPQNNEPDKDLDRDGKPAKNEDNKQDLDDIYDPYKKYLEDSIDQDDRDANLKKVEAAKRSLPYQEKKGDLEKAERLLEMLRAQRRKNNAVQPSIETDKQLVNDYLKLEKMLAPYADQMARHWLEIVNNIAQSIEVFRAKYFRSGKIDLKKLQRFWPEMKLGAEVDQKMVYTRMVEKILIEIKPKMLRMLLLVDNSGSMKEYINQIRMCVMLLNSSLRSLKVLFKAKMDEVLGPNSSNSLDLICDIETRRFGEECNRYDAASGIKYFLIKKFKFQDLTFLKDKSGKDYPKINIDQEIIDTLLTFEKIDAADGDTKDSEVWTDTSNVHNEDEQLKELLAQNIVTEVIFQISDGAIKETATTIPIIQKIRDLGIAVAGLSIGGEKAKAALSQRHGSERVAHADTAQQIVAQFGGLLKMVVKEKIEKPMVEYLERMGEGV